MTTRRITTKTRREVREHIEQVKAEFIQAVKTQMEYLCFERGIVKDDIVLINAYLILLC